MNHELFDYRYAAHLAAFRADLYRELGDAKKLRAERKHLNGLRERVRYWEGRSRGRRQLIADGTMS